MLKSLSFKTYTGPADGRSHPSRIWDRPLRLATHAMLATTYRIEIEGKENIPKKGLLGLTHPSTTDPLVALTFSPPGTRFMAAKELFRGPLGLAMTAMGAYPVDREHPSPVVVEHTEELLRDGKLVVIFPEGGCTKKDIHRVDPLKKGPANFSINTGAHITPGASEFKENDKPRWGERIIGWTTAAATVVGGIFAAAVAPVATAIVGGALAGHWIGGEITYRMARSRKFSSAILAPRLIGVLAGGVVGGAAAGVAAAFLGPMVATGAAVAGGLGVLAIARYWRNRTVIHVAIGKDMSPAPYAAEPDRHQGVYHYTERLHEEMGHLKEHVSGVPYDGSVKVAGPRHAPANPAQAPAEQPAAAQPPAEAAPEPVAAEVPPVPLT
jgi:1-acyl-sn-glycerol-3-phosphate acyltransferase